MDYRTRVRRAAAKIGGCGQLAKALRLSRTACYLWTRCPAERVLAVAKITGVSASYLRPDLYPADVPVAPPSGGNPEARPT